ncbi:MAG TPA: EamA family transporter RarD [Geopsychrobacteraceae bacterium]|nr:EamA family transporter RarD [Geopsychrobacteraceae bacterium]
MNRQLSAILFGIAAFLAWGFLPAYWKQLQAVAPIEILCHRVIWSCVFLCIIIAIQKRWGEVRDIVGNSGNLKKLMASGLLIGGNWFTYIWAVNSGHVVETSLGYYINPMVNVVIGFLLLRERFSRLQSSALLFATAGVSYSLIAYGKPPWFALTLAFSFAFYGYARKKIPVAPIPGLLVETCMLLVPALGYVLYRQFYFDSLFGTQLAISLWLIGSGIATSLPLLWFATATKTLKLSSIGIMQYLAPTIAFCLGVFVYQEPFDSHNVMTFILIWFGVIIFCFDTVQRSRRRY